MSKRFVRELEIEAARIFRNTRRVFVPDFLARQMDLVEAAYGRKCVLEDFREWAEGCKDSGVRYPISEYLKVVDIRIGGAEEEVADPRVEQVRSSVYERTGHVPRKGSVGGLLKKYSQEDILYAFDEFVASTDEAETKAAAKRFFEDGDGETVLYTLLNKQGE